MSDGYVEDLGNEEWRLTARGAQAAVEIYKLYQSGYNYKDIAYMMGFDNEAARAAVEEAGEEYQPEVMVQVLIAMGDISGVFDLEEVRNYLDEE